MNTRTIQAAKNSKKINRKAGSLIDCMIPLIGSRKCQEKGILSQEKLKKRKNEFLSDRYMLEGVQIFFRKPVHSICYTDSEWEKELLTLKCMSTSLSTHGGVQLWVTFAPTGWHLLPRNHWPRTHEGYCRCLSGSIHWFRSAIFCSAYYNKWDGRRRIAYLDSNQG